MDDAKLMDVKIKAALIALKPTAHACLCAKGAKEAKLDHN
jgi:hypothetical protein